MPSNTYIFNASTTARILFGASRNRTAWTIYNIDSSINVYWGNNRGNIYSMFRVPAGGSWTLKIPEDDPTKEVWILAESGAPQIYVYEGFAE